MKPVNPAPKPPSARRHLVVVDEADLVLGKADQDRCHSGEGILHSAFLAMIFDRQKRLLEARRSRHKRLWPFFWDGTVAGHFYPGEDREETVKKRIADEIGLACDGLRYMFRFSYQALYQDIGLEREVCHVYFAAGIDGQEIVLNAREVSEARFLEIPRTSELVAAGAVDFTPWFLLAFRKGKEGGFI
jgi:isopentenyl-diphosphate delta-isomerase